MWTGRTRWTVLTGSHLFKKVKICTKNIHLQTNYIGWLSGGIEISLGYFMFEFITCFTTSRNMIYEIWVYRLVRTNYISRSTVLTAPAVRANMRNPIRAVGGGWGLKIVKLDWACIDSDELQVLNKYLLYIFTIGYSFFNVSHIYDISGVGPSISTYNTSQNVTPYIIESVILTFCILICSMNINCI